MKVKNLLQFGVVGFFLCTIGVALHHFFTPTSIQAENDLLLEEIQSYAEKHAIEPVDAKVDRVWKAIPGYNGLKVDVEASYAKMRKRKTFDEKQIVLKQIKPKVRLQDLPPSPIYKGNPEKPMVSFLINVAWGNEFIPPMIETLDKHDVKTTFFFDGSWVSKNPDIAKMIYEKGHEIGNHAYSHPDLSRYSRADTSTELSKTNDVIEKTIGVKPIWFAPPSGSFNEETVNVARELDMFTILWTVDTVDWRQPATSEMVNRVLPQVENGTMILMHPTKPVAEGLDTMIQEIREKGYVLGTVSDMMSENRIQS